MSAGQRKGLRPSGVGGRNTAFVAIGAAWGFSSETRRIASVGGILAIALGVIACDKDAVERKKLTRHGGRPAVVTIGTPREHSAPMTEVEPNNESDEAQVLAGGVVLEGVLAGSADIDRYGVNALGPGRMQVFLEGAEDADLRLELRGARNKVLALSDRGPAGTSEGISGFPIEEGTEYELVVSEFVGKKLSKAGGRKGDSAPYRLSWEMAAPPTPGFEIEPNDNAAEAGEILRGEERRGFIGWKGDVDTWRLAALSTSVAEPSGGSIAPVNSLSSPPVSGFAVAPNAALDIVLSAPPGVALRLALLSEQGVLLARRRAGRGQELALRSFVPVDAGRPRDAGQPKGYLLRVQGKSSNPEVPYTLRVEERTLEPGSEREPNDTPATATLVAADASSLLLLHGDLSGGDVDIFRLEPAAVERTLSLDIKGQSGAQLEAVLVAASGAELLRATTSAGVGAEDARSPSLVLLQSGTSPMLQIAGTGLSRSTRYEVSLRWGRRGE